MPEDTLFLTLRIFSATGGIEKVSQVAGKAMHELQQEGKLPGGLRVYSMYDRDEEINEKYFPAGIFRGFGTNKMQFMRAAVSAGTGSRVVIMSHINLLLAGYLVKLFSPQTKLVLIAHGIEVWKPLPGWKLRMLRRCDRILPVSRFTREKMKSLFGLPDTSFTVLNNCLDPFLEDAAEEGKDPALLQRYGLFETDFVLLTLTRLSSKERYKGYDNVLYAIKNLKEEYPNLRYLVVGKYDDREKRRMENIIRVLELQDNVIFTGFVADEELSRHYQLADLYIMPSKKEGFGIVFIEAMFYGKTVIAGNKDGSVDALAGGELGLLVNPDSKEEITAALEQVLSNPITIRPTREAVIQRFGFPAYKKNLQNILSSIH